MPSKKKADNSQSKKQPETVKQNVENKEPPVQGQGESSQDEPVKEMPQEEQIEVDTRQQTSAHNPRLSSSWYGTWPKKSQESLVPSPVPQEPVDTESKKKSTQPKDIPARRAPLLSPGSSSRSLPLVATITKLNISSEGSKSVEHIEEQGSTDEGTDKSVDGKQPNDSNVKPKPAADAPAVVESDAAAGTVTPTSWLSWSMRGDRSLIPSINITSPLSRGDTAAKSESTTAVNTEPTSKVDMASPTDHSVSEDSSSKSEPVAQTTWYPRWVFGGANGTEAGKPAAADSGESTKPLQEDTVMPDADQNSTKLDTEAKRSSWAFWSTTAAQGNNASGQLAVADSASQSHPEPAVVREEGSVPTTEDKKKRPLSQGDEPAKKKPAPSVDTTVKKVDEKVKETPNILLPTFESTYSLHVQNPSFWEQIGSWIYSNNAPKHPTLLKEPRKIKHALAIGVHGYFPGAIVQTLLGKPTGTSIKFADSAAKAIERFTEKHGYTLQSIDKIALEGEGRIDERLDILWKLLLNWIDMIRKADFILVACHSQGVPVAISLVSKLIGFGCVSEARIGICAMAGISRGPFAEYKSRWIGGSAAELFEFSDPSSPVSQAYKNALETAVRFGVRVVYVGSLDDQLVPLHSSTFTAVDHPNIYRAVFVDGRMHVADFMSHLVGFALKLRNLNTSDHGLIRELSNPLAGSLVGGEGHSRIYDDPAVYDLAMDFTLRTSDVSGRFETDDSPIPTTMNPFILPFAMRGVLEEDVVRKELSDEVIDLLKQFDRWKPSTKVLRDVKYRLEGVRSKL